MTINQRKRIRLFWGNGKAAKDLIQNNLSHKDWEQLVSEYKERGIHAPHWNQKRLQWYSQCFSSGGKGILHEETHWGSLSIFLDIEAETLLHKTRREV